MEKLQFLACTIEERSRTLESLVNIVEERTRLLEVLVRTTDERSLVLERLILTIEERSRTLECMLAASEQRAQTVQDMVHTIEERSNTLEYVARQSLYSLTHQVDQFQKFYIEAIPKILNLLDEPAFNASKALQLNTDYPIAVQSNDHIDPDSTTEGVSRPTLFVQDCIRVLGTKMITLDLGSGAAGLVYEFAMNQIVAVGIDGSDFCRINGIGFWPLLRNNLFTCDITKPFSFVSAGASELCEFDLITSWEVLEHIGESDLPALFANIRRHLAQHGYFIGSISMLEYDNGAGIPYHVTIKPPEWWRQRFLENGLVILDSHPFIEKLFCRGNGPRYQDYHNYARHPEDGFLFVAKLT